MAGEFQDCVSLQADTLPTGSISFGRFELESLSWERRSSFSHNRYLEEVEKYSTPGSVTQKKAYFEAHFRKKALERQASSEVHNELEWQSTENGIEDHISYIEEYAVHGNDEHMRFARDNEMPDISNEEEHDMETTGRHLHFSSWYHGTPPAVSDEDEYEVIEGNEGQHRSVQNSESRTVTGALQHDIIDCELERDNPSLEIPTEPMRSDNMKALDYPNELVEQDEVPQSESRYDTTDTDDMMVVVEQKKENGLVNANELLGKFNVSCNSKVEKDTATCLKKTENGSFSVCSEVELYHPTVEQKPSKAKQWNPEPVTQITGKYSVEKNSLSSVKAFNRTSRKTERENTPRIKKGKQASLKFSPSTFSESINIKTKNSRSLKSPAIQVTRSLNLEEKKDNAGTPSVSTNRSTRKDVCSTKTDMKQSSSVFSFRCDERAEKRKEFNTKLEEKHYAKEVEMNESQAKTQIEIEAEMKQLRRRLNFKATPMPSFYHGTVPSDCNGRQVVVTQTKSLKLERKSTRSGGRAAPKANSAISKPAESKCSSENEQVKSTHTECRTAPEGGGTSYSITTAKVPSKAEELRESRRVPRSAKNVADKNIDRKKPTDWQQQGEHKSKKGERDGLVRRVGVGKAMKGNVG